MSIRKTIFAIAALCCMLQASVFATAYGNKNQINISGATLFANFFAAPAGTNDYLGVDQGLNYMDSTGSNLYTDGDLYRLYDPYGFGVDQLAFSDWTSTDVNNRWVVQSRGVGSGTGLKELDLYYNSAPPASSSNFVVPNDKSYINRTQWGYSGGLMGPAVSTNPGGNPIAPTRIDMAVMDVPTTWLVMAGADANANWQARPLEAAYGYGRNPITSWDTAQSNKLKSLTNLNLNSTANALTIVDTQVAWVPIAFITNQGTGLQNVTQNDLEYLYATGRMSGGENLYACTRDSGSGTRNGAMNSLGLDPSWGRGDNMGTKNSNGNVSYVGPLHQSSNLDGTSVMANAVTSQRLAIGYVGLTTANSATGTSNAAYQILNLKKTGGAQYVRPSRENTVDNNNIDTGWQVGGSETFATVGSPDQNAAFVMSYNRYARDYLWNIKKSIDEFISPSASDDLNNMPGQYMAKNWSLVAGLKAVPDDVNHIPSDFVANSNYSANVNAYYKANGPTTPAWVDGPGKVPTRIVGPAYSDGTTGSYYLASDGTTLANGGTLNARNKIMGDFDGDGKRTIGDIHDMMVAFSNPRGFETSSATGVCPEIIGDFTADGNFTAEDIRYFADGLAVVDPNNRQVNRAVGFALVDQAWTATLAAIDANHTAGNFFNTVLAHGTYLAGSGWSKADVAKTTWRTTNPNIGYVPSADGTIDACDIDYIYYIQRGGLKAKAFGQTLAANCNSWQKTMRWSNLDDAIWMDLSCDLNGDMKVDIEDVRIIVEDILGTHFGDINLDGVVNAADIAIITAHLGQQGGWAQGDVDGDGWVTQCDLDIANGLVAIGGEVGSPDLNGDHFVNFEDFAIFANSWLQSI